MYFSGVSVGGVIIGGGGSDWDAILLEDAYYGYYMLLETGDKTLLESDTGYDLLMEDGFGFLLENGDNLLLE